MAKAAQKKPAAAAKGAKGKGAAAGGSKSSASTRIAMFVGMIALVPFSIPTMLLLFAGLLPTLIAALTDRSPARYAWICVGGLNFAGLAPALLKLWFGHHEITFALHQVTDIRVLLLAYLSAGAGWMLYVGAPPVVIAVMLATTKRRAAALVVQMKKLEEEWGAEVARGTYSNNDDDVDL
jgi:hypothetical protein